MPDATITALVNTLNAQISGSGATPAAILALSTALVSGSQTRASAPQSGQVGILAAAVNRVSYGIDISWTNPTKPVLVASAIP